MFVYTNLFMNASGDGRRGIVIHKRKNFAGNFRHLCCLDSYRQNRSVGMRVITYERGEK